MNGKVSYADHQSLIGLPMNKFAELLGIKSLVLQDRIEMKIVYGCYRMTSLPLELYFIFLDGLANHTTFEEYRRPDGMLQIYLFQLT